MKRVSFLVAGMFMLGSTLSGPAVSASVTLAGSTVDFSFDDALPGLFGTPGVSGDTLFFTPTTFAAQSLNGAGFSLTHASANIRITAREGRVFDTLGLIERGDYLLYGAGSLVEVGGQLRAFDVSAPQADLTAAIAANGPLTAQGLPTHDWTAGAVLDASVFDGRTISVTIENLLLASTATPGTLAFVEKKYAGLNVSTLAAPVPEADTWVMMLTGLGLLGCAARRRRQMAGPIMPE